MAFKEGSFGFDAAKGQHLDLMEAGIIDPTKVVRTGSKTRCRSRACYALRGDPNRDSGTKTRIAADARTVDPKEHHETYSERY
jgi:chaperonin GroEL (HSP60 family)